MNDQIIEDPYDVYNYLLYEYYKYESECFEEFEKENEKANGNVIKDFKNLQKYITSIRIYVKSTIESNDLFRKLPEKLKHALLNQYTNGHFTHYCDIYNRSIPRGNNVALEDVRREAVKAIQEMERLVDLIHEYDIHHDTAKFGRRRRYC